VVAPSISLCRLTNRATYVPTGGGYLHRLVLGVEREDLLDQGPDDLQQELSADRLAVGRQQVGRDVVATKER
jgi:hypothetical protein